MLFFRKRSKNSDGQATSEKTNLELLNELDLNTKSKAFKRYNDAGLLEKIDPDFVNEVRQFWDENYVEDTIDPIFHLAFMNLTGRKEVNLVSPNIMTNDIVPFFNDPKMRGVYKDKNLYTKMVSARPPKSVENIVKRIYGTYYDENDKIISSETAESKIYDSSEDLIIKPSNTNNGLGIKKLKFKNSELYLDGEKVTLKDLESKYGGHFIIQKLIKQHLIIAAPHPSSVNTLRMVTFRWKNEIRHLLTFARFGTDNNVQDNAGAGGVCVGVKDTGEFLDIAIDEHCNTYTHHPTTGFCFADLQPIPNYNEFKEYVIKLHEDILHHDFVSWDIAVGENGQPVFIELNLRGATWLYQLAAQRPLFGDLTKEVIQHVSREQNSDESPRKKILTEQQKMRMKIRKQSKQIKKLKKQIAELEAELDSLKKSNK